MSDPATAANKLREKQKPLKDQYRSDPSSALVTLSSRGNLDAGLSCSLATASQAKMVAGLHPAAGGSGFDASGELCSGDMLLESLVACFGVTVRAVSTSMGVPLEGGSVTCEGDLDFRGTMGIKDPSGDQVPVGFKAIRLSVRLEVADEYKGQAEKLIELSERYCVVLQTLKAGVNVETKLGHVGQAVPDTRKDQHIEETTNGSGEGMQMQVDNDEVIRLQ